MLDEPAKIQVCFWEAMLMVDLYMLLILLLPFAANML